MRFPPAAAVVVGIALMVGGDARRGDVRKDGALEAAAELVLRVAPDGGAPVRGTLAAGTKVTVGVRQGSLAADPLRRGRKRDVGMGGGAGAADGDGRVSFSAG